MNPLTSPTSLLLSIHPSMRVCHQEWGLESDTRQQWTLWSQPIVRNRRRYCPPQTTSAASQQGGWWGLDYIERKEEEKKRDFRTHKTISAFSRSQFGFNLLKNCQSIMAHCALLLLSRLTLETFFVWQGVSDVCLSIPSSCWSSKFIFLIQRNRLEDGWLIWKWCQVPVALIVSGMCLPMIFRNWYSAIRFIVMRQNGSNLSYFIMKINFYSLSVLSLGQMQ